MNTSKVELFTPPPVFSERRVATLPPSQQPTFAAQHRKLFEAMAALVGERGYRSVKIADLVSRAGLSRGTFYDHFDDKEGCFLEAQYWGTAQLFERIRAACVGEGEWPMRLHAALGASLTYFSQRPDLAWLLLGEPPVVAPAARSYREDSIDSLAAALRAGRAELGVSPSLTDLLEIGLIAGIVEVLARHIAAAEAGRCRSRSTSCARCSALTWVPTRAADSQNASNRLHRQYRRRASRARTRSFRWPPRHGPIRSPNLGAYRAVATPWRRQWSLRISAVAFCLRWPPKPPATATPRSPSPTSPGPPRSRCAASTTTSTTGRARFLAAIDFAGERFQVALQDRPPAPAGFGPRSPPPSRRRSPSSPPSPTWPTCSSCRRLSPVRLRPRVIERCSAAAQRPCGTLPARTPACPQRRPTSSLP